MPFHAPPSVAGWMLTSRAIWKYMLYIYIKNVGQFGSINAGRRLELFWTVLHERKLNTKCFPAIIPLFSWSFVKPASILVDNIDGI